MNYPEAVGATWRHHDLGNAGSDYTNLVRYATLAASSHNTQPWKFQLEPGRITIHPDLSRRCPEVDPDDHHLYASLGCAVENLLEAAAAAGLRGQYVFDQEASAVRVDLEQGRSVRSELFDAIPRRQCSRVAYDGSPATAEELRQLEASGGGEGFSIMLLTSEDKKARLTEFVAEGNAVQIGDPGWFGELVNWIRFNGRDAVKTGDGLYGKAMGSPNVPEWLGRIIIRLALKPKAQSTKDAEFINSSAGVAVFVSEVNDRAHWVEAGRCYERFALQAAALGLRTAFINPPVEVPRLRSQFASWLGVGERRPSLVVRFGRGPEMPRSLRRPVEEVIV